MSGVSFFSSHIHHRLHNTLHIYIILYIYYIIILYCVYIYNSEVPSWKWLAQNPCRVRGWYVLLTHRTSHIEKMGDFLR